METIYISRAVANAKSIEDVVEIINGGGTCEGMEGVEFTPEQLAGRYAEDAAYDSDYPVDAGSIKAHLEFLAEAGAIFEESAAVAHGLTINAARDKGE